MKLISWNVNGIRAVDRKGFFDWFKKENPDILCLQEIKATADQFPPHLRSTPEYHVYINPAQRKGYSGVTTYSKLKPEYVRTGFNFEKFDQEGRILITEYPTFALFNIYFPNGKQSDERLNYKLDFYNTFLDYAEKIKQEGKHIIVCGDFNTAHKIRGDLSGFFNIFFKFFHNDLIFFFQIVNMS